MEVSEESRVIAGRYVLESLIGEGGMASVWRARDLTLERQVAVKLLFARDERDQPRIVHQFLREARIAASVHHRNVIHIVDFGSTGQQQPFMVMELLEGESLGQRMQRKPPLTMAEIVHIAALTLRGLAAVHNAGIIHRDLKPDNVFLTRDPNGLMFPKILDFGISRSTEPRSGRRSALTTRDGMIVGTPEYMSPEQARGVRTVDKRSDLYSMGCILYEALTGRLPFECENVGDLIIQIVTSSATPVHEVNPAVPRPLSDLVAKAMARSPDERFQDAPAMQQALLGLGEIAVELAAPATGLSDAPPVAESSPTLPRASLERVRTLEFAFDDEPSQPATVEPVSPGETAAGEVSAVNVRPVSRRKLRAGAAMGVALAAAALAWWVQRDTNSHAAAMAPQAPAPAPEAAAVTPSELAGVLHVQLRNLPKDAVVSIDGIQVEAASPIELPRDERNRVIRVVAPGKAPWQAVHHASGDATYEVWLVDSPPPAPKAAPHRAASARPAAARPKAHKKPPSALRNLDF